MDFVSACTMDFVSDFKIKIKLNYRWNSLQGV